MEMEWMEMEWMEIGFWELIRQQVLADQYTPGSEGKKDTHHLLMTERERGGERERY